MKYLNECCNCAVPGYPCNGMHKKVPVRFCDECGEEFETLYIGVSGRELCAYCALEELEVAERNP